MPRRTLLTSRQRAALLELPTDLPSLLRHYTLCNEDYVHIRRRRRPHNKLGFALQLCVLRYPGRLLNAGETVPLEILSFLGDQLALTATDVLAYAERRETRREHFELLRQIYGFRSFTGTIASQVRKWVKQEALYARSNEDLAKRFVENCREHLVVVPAITTIERLCAEALASSERHLEAVVSGRLTSSQRESLIRLLNDTIDGRLTRFAWLRRFEVGSNSASANRLLDRYEYLHAIELPEDLFHEIPSHQITRLTTQGERYFADDMRELNDARKLAILGACVVVWRRKLVDAVVDTHDRIIGKLYRDSERQCAERFHQQKRVVRDTLSTSLALGKAMLSKEFSHQSVDEFIVSSIGWEALQAMVSGAEHLDGALSDDPLEHVLDGYVRLRRYAPRMLRTIHFHGAHAAKPLLLSLQALVDKRNEIDTAFIRRGSKWRRYVRQKGGIHRKYWEIAALFHLREGLRSGDIWIYGSLRYGDMRTALVSYEEVQNSGRLAVPVEFERWLGTRHFTLEQSFNALSLCASQGRIPDGSIERDSLRLDRITGEPNDNAEALAKQLYKRVPEARITDILLEVDRDLDFTDAFPNLRSGSPCRDRIGLMNVILSDGANLGLRKMAEATDSHGFWDLMRIGRWHIEGDAYKNALAVVVKAQSELPMSSIWGDGNSASSDGQFFPVTQGAHVMNLANPRYGSGRGLKAYTHVVDYYSPFSTQLIPATASEAPYILDGLLMNATGQAVKEQYTDTGGFTDHVFAVCSLLGYAFVPRIRDFPSKRLYALDRGAVPENIRPLIGGKINARLIEQNWADVLRLAVTMTTGAHAPSQILRKLASWGRLRIGAK